MSVCAGPRQRRLGSVEEELPFLTAALSWLNTPVADEADPNAPDKNKNYWSAFGEWYFVGYGEGCAPLEVGQPKIPSSSSLRFTAANRLDVEAFGEQRVATIRSSGHDERVSIVMPL